MLQKILTEQDCAECKLCCGFFKSEIWEVPVIDDNLTRLLGAKYNYEFDKKNNRIFKITYDEKGLCKCPVLGENGCKLGNRRPFDCKIWPFRVMKLGEFTVIALSPLCKKINQKPLSEITEFVNGEFLEIIKARVSIDPALVKDYVDGYVTIKII